MPPRDRSALSNVDVSALRFAAPPSPHLTPFLPAVPAEKEIISQVHIVQKAASFSGWCFLFLLLGGLTNEKTLSQKHFRAVGSADLLHNHSQHRSHGLCRSTYRRNCGFVLGGVPQRRGRQSGLQRHMGPRRAALHERLDIRRGNMDDHAAHHRLLRWPGLLLHRAGRSPQPVPFLRKLWGGLLGHLPRRI